MCPRWVGPTSGRPWQAALDCRKTALPTFLRSHGHFPTGMDMSVGMWLSQKTPWAVVMFPTQLCGPGATSVTTAARSASGEFTGHAASLFMAVPEFFRIGGPPRPGKAATRHPWPWCHHQNCPGAMDTAWDLSVTSVCSCFRGRCERAVLVAA